MIKVASSILSADHANLQEDIEKVEKAGAPYLHIDVMDGTSVPSISYGPGFVRAIRPITNMVLDVYLMVESPEHILPMFIDAGADIIGVQVETTQHIHRTLQVIKSGGVKTEVAINPGTPVAMIELVLYMVNQVLVITINPGFGGQKFLLETVDKIAQLSAIKEEKGYNFDIEVDGGVNDKTIVDYYKAGATVAVAGSYVLNAKDPAERIKATEDVTK